MVRSTMQCEPRKKIRPGKVSNEKLKTFQNAFLCDKNRLLMRVYLAQIRSNMNNEVLTVKIGLCRNKTIKVVRTQCELNKNALVSKRIFT